MAFFSAAGTSELKAYSKWRIALRLLQPGQQTIFAFLVGSRVAVGLCDLLLASAMYWLFVILQGRAPTLRFSWLPVTALNAALFASVLVVLRALLDVFSSRSVFRHIQELGSDFLLRLTRGYSEMEWSRYVECNRSELSGHALYTSRGAADFYHRCIELLSGFLTIAIMTAALVYQSPMAAAMFGCALAIFWGIHRFFIRNDITRAAAERESAMRSMCRELANLFSSGKELRTYGNYGFFDERIRYQAEQLATSNQRVVFLPQLSRTIADQGTMLLFLAFIIIAECQHGDANRLTAVLAFYFVLSRRLLPLISQLSIILGQMESSYENVRILDAEFEECERYSRKQTAFELPVRGCALEVQHLSFAYSQAHQILRMVNLAVAEGEIIVLRGASGSGKSSLLNLIGDILSPQEGQIKIDRHAVSYVPQEITLLDASIRENLLFGLPRRNDEELMIAARIAKLDTLIAAQPYGLNTRVGDNGALFSGGERQRFGIARAVLRGSRLLLLDEATSALDEYTEKDVLENLRTTGVTIVLATHHLHHWPFANRVFRLESGHLIDETTLQQGRTQTVISAATG